MEAKQGTGVFMPLINRTAEVRTGKGTREWRDGMQQRAAGGS